MFEDRNEPARGKEPESKGITPSKVASSRTRRPRRGGNFTPLHLFKVIYLHMRSKVDVSAKHPFEKVVLMEVG